MAAAKLLFCKVESNSRIGHSCKAWHKFDLEYVNTCHCWYIDSQNSTSYRELLRSAHTGP